jgi:hypothetical protein
MEERVQYLDVVTHVPVVMDSLGISVKVTSIFIELCVFRVIIINLKDHGVIIEVNICFV